MALWDGYDNVEFRVVVNDVGQYSIWPASRSLPHGWFTTCITGAQSICVQEIDRRWREGIPRSVAENGLSEAERGPMDSAGAILYGPERTVPDVSIMSLIRASEIPSDRTAAVSGSVQLTRGELFARSSAWATGLTEAGCGREVPVIVLLPRGLDALTAILAVLEAGGAYVPVSCANTTEQIEAILRDCAAPIVISTDDHIEKLDSFRGRILTVGELETWTDRAGRHTEAAKGSDLSFIFYTSGTTGEPKGVEGTHEQLVNYALWCGKAFPHLPNEVMFLSASLFFLGSLTTIFTPLLMGWPIVIAPDGASTDSLLELTRTVNGGLLKLTPTHIRMMMARGVPHTGLARQLMVGSEPLTFTQELASWLAADPRRSVVNHYGLTETHGCFCHWLTGEEPVGSRVSIGKPIDNVFAVVVDRDGSPVSAGEVGELLVAGPSLGRGYRDRPALTAQRWIPNPWGPAGSRLLRTGDLARFEQDGTVTVLGRADRQVKVRGHRVEPAAVEEKLRRAAGVAEALVLPRTDDGAVTLDAYLLRAENAEIDLATIRAELAATFPEQWVPARMAALAEFPVNANGKVDIKALPKPKPVRRTAPQDTASSRWLRLELVVGTAFCDVLKVDDIGLGDNFYELGGDSLSSVQVAAQIGAAIGHPVPAPVGGNATVRGYARAIVASSPALPRAVAEAAPGLVDGPPSDDCRSFGLNQAQARNLRNWAVDDLASKTLPVVVPVTPPASVDDAMRAVQTLASRHEALRSTLITDQDGRHHQQVRASSTLAHTEEDASRAADVWTPVRLSPHDGAATVTLYVHDGMVELIRLTVSHVFADAMGAVVLSRELHALLHGEPLLDAPAQPSILFHDPLHAQLERTNTEYWLRLLSRAPRSCTYSGIAREAVETEQVATVPLTDTVVSRIADTSKLLGVTPYVLWTTATSALVSALTGQHHQVFRSTYANRFSQAEFGAVAQLAQAVYLPISGSARDTFRARAEQVSELFWATHDKALYSATELLKNLDEPSLARGAVFQPAFEVNHLPKYDDVERRPLVPGLTDQVRAIDPQSAKADLAVLVSHSPEPTLRLTVRKPLHSQRTARDLAENLLRVVAALCQEPEQVVDAVPVAPLASVAELLTGHHSGVAVSPASTSALVLSIPGVKSCRVEIAGTKLRAHVHADESLIGDDLVAALRDRQPWWSGSVVPDEVVVETAAAHQATNAAEASS